MSETFSIMMHTSKKLYQLNQKWLTYNYVSCDPFRIVQKCSIWLRTIKIRNQNKWYNGKKYYEYDFYYDYVLIKSIFSF